MNILRLRIASNILINAGKDLNRIADGKKPLYNSYTTSEDIDNIVEDIININHKTYEDNNKDTPKVLYKQEAAKRMNISRATFDRKVHDGYIPNGKKIAYQKGLEWSRNNIDELITQNPTD